MSISDKVIRLVLETRPLDELLFLFDTEPQRTQFLLSSEDFPSELVRVERDPLPATTDEMPIRLYPSDSLIRFLTASRTIDRNINVVENPGHE